MHLGASRCWSAWPRSVMKNPLWKLSFRAACVAAVLAGLQPAHAELPAEPQASRHEPSSADLEAFIDPLINDQLARLKIAGAVVVVVKDASILLAKGFGYADVAEKKPMTAHATLVRVGSISKVF